SSRDTQLRLVGCMGKKNLSRSNYIHSKGRKSYPTIYHANSYYMSKRGLPKWGNPYGNRASVVVRARESLVHGEGKQPISFNVKFWKM
ncbi:hypothetical protein, partial [Phocaeicola vulgatus]